MTTRTTKQRALAIADQLGVTLDYGGMGTDFEITVDAPDGYHWASETHQLVESIWDDQKPADLWKSIADRMSQGLEKCDTANADCADLVSN